jgi:hypothetical protein
MNNGGNNNVILKDALVKLEAIAIRVKFYRALNEAIETEKKGTAPL